MSLFLRGPSVLDLAATPDGTQHRFTMSATATAALAPGVYGYAIRATRGSDVVEVERGTIEVLADLAGAVAGYDPRTQARRSLDSINAVLEKRASQDQKRYIINNRELERTPIPELLKLRDFFMGLVRAEEACAAGRGLWGPAVRVRM